MKSSLSHCIVFLACLGATGLSACADPAPAEPPPPDEVEASQECDSCSLRHQRLGKSDEEKERERANLKKIFENSQTNDQEP